MTGRGTVKGRDRMRRLLVRFSLGLIFFSSSFGAMLLCKSVPLQLFFRPPGTEVETYKRSPVPLELVVYPAPQNKAARGAVVFIHGGGWSVAGAGVPTYQDWHEPLQTAGLRAFAVEHRVPPEYRGRDHINDCVDAIRYIENNAARFGIPANRLALVGFSSGGHLAVMSGLSLSRPRPGIRSLASAGPVRAVVAYYAPLDPERLLDQNPSPALREVLVNYLPRYALHSRAVAGDAPREEELRRSFYERALKDISPMQHVHAFAPPMLLLHGVRDDLIPVQQSRSFFEHANQVRPGMIQLREVERGDHHFIRSRSRWARAVDQAAIDFIVEALGSDPLL